jgi:5-methyltetrahydropteroyltriglutamate--homocysteine methyltransferase
MNISKGIEVVNIQSCDVGSLPFKGDLQKFQLGAKNFAGDVRDDKAEFFENQIVATFLDKLRVGVEVPAYPQFRDMSKMFLSLLEGLEETEDGYLETGNITVPSNRSIIPEFKALYRNLDLIETQTLGSFQLRVCITGPYTLASFIRYRNSATYKNLGQALSQIVDKNIFSGKRSCVVLVSIDEPLFGIIDDPLIERGTDGRENLLSAWESIAKRARNRKTESCIHLHSTSDDLFWEIEPLTIVESHVGDPLYEMKTTKHLLEKRDKMLKASIAISDFDQLIANERGSASYSAVADAWRSMSMGGLNADTFLESVDDMRKRLLKITDFFGVERVRLAGPECGLRGFPTYESALQCLKRSSDAIESMKVSDE